MSWQTTIANRPIDVPAFPFVTNNRVFVCAKIPFQNEYKLISMSDDCDSQLRIPSLWDRNYTNDFYEIVTAQTNPVLQVVYRRPNEIQVNGIWLIDPTNLYICFLGYTPALLSPRVEVTDLKTKQILTNIIMEAAWDTNTAFDIPISGRKAHFKYPSWKYPGVADSQ